MEKLKILKDNLGRGFNSNEEMLFYCPYCKHHKKKFSVNVDKGCYKCWICDIHGRSIRRVIRRFGDYTQLREWDKLDGRADILQFDEMFSEVKKEFSNKRLTLPEEFATLTGRSQPLSSIKAMNYLENRGSTKEDIIRWKIGFCTRGQFEGRIIVPSFDEEGYVNYFIARSFTGDWRKYMNPSATKDVVFNHLFIDWDSDLSLVEGVFDAIKAGPNSIPLLGSTLREESKLFQEIVKNDTPVFVALDIDAEKKAFSIISKLVSYGVEVYKIDTSGFQDVGEMSKQEYQERKENAEFVNPDTFKIEHSLNSIGV